MKREKKKKRGERRNEMEEEKEERKERNLSIGPFQGGKDLIIGLSIPFCVLRLSEQK
jgi:hypothetical protein